jgi:sugar-specific transcriptional regulator TrmB
MDINEKLLECGLTRNEAKVYLELAKKGELSANSLAKNLGIDRTLTYTILNHLIEKGQVKYIKRENKKFFSCSEPNNLLNHIKAKEAVISQLILDLTKLKHENPGETEVNIYEGTEGIRVLYRELQNSKNFDSFGATGRAYNLLFESHSIAKKAEKAKFQVRIITNNEHAKEEFLRYNFIKAKYFDIKSEATTCIFGDKISIHLIKGKPIVIIIKNKEISESYRNYFNYLWKSSK